MSEMFVRRLVISLFVALPIGVPQTAYQGSSSKAHLTTKEDPSTSCLATKNEYIKRSRRIIVRNDEDAIQYESMSVELATNEVKDVLIRGLLELLTVRSTANELELTAFINCVQTSDDYSNLHQLTNSPAVFRRRLNGTETVAVAFWIYRGYSAVPDMSTYLIFLKRDQNHWRLCAQTGSLLSGHSFYARELRSDGDSLDFLLYGNRIGDTGSRLNAQVVRFDGKEVHTIWQKTELPRSQIDSIRLNEFTIIGEKVSEGKAAPVSDTYRFDGKKITLVEGIPEGH